jgi:hypothetical protein
MIDSIVIFIFIFCLYSFYIRLGKGFPIAQLAVLFFSLQYLLVPLLFYNGVDEQMVNNHITMGSNKVTYFNLAIPCTIVFIFALLYKEYIPDLNIIKSNLTYFGRNTHIGYLLIAFGVFGNIFKSSNIMILNFPGFIFSTLIYSGAFIFLFSKTPFYKLVLVGVIFFLIFDALITGMFGEMLIWLLLIYSAYCIKEQPSHLNKVITMIFGFFLTVFIQSAKYEYRDRLWSNKEGVSIGMLNEVNSIQKSTSFSEKILNSVERFNQGYFLSLILDNVPSKTRRENGIHSLQIIRAAFLPRFLAPDKIKSGNTDALQYYGNIIISESTVMVIGLIGDLYIDFDVLGTVFCVFIYALFFRFMLKFNFKQSLKKPFYYLLIPSITYYTIRPDNDTHTALGHLVKATFLLLVFTLVIQNYYKSYFKTNV